MTLAILKTPKKTNNSSKTNRFTCHHNAIDGNSVALVAHHVERECGREIAVEHRRRQRPQIGRRAKRLVRQDARPNASEIHVARRRLVANCDRRSAVIYEIGWSRTKDRIVPTNKPAISRVPLFSP